MRNNYIFKPLFLIFILLNYFAYANNSSSKISIQLNWKYQFEYAGFIIAKEKGFYNEIGFNVDLLEFNNNVNSIDDVLNNKVTFAITDSLLMIERQEKDIVLLANYLKQSPLVIATNKKITHPKDLENMLFMSSKERLKNTPLDFMFKHLGVDLEKINFKENTYHVEELIDNKTDAMEVYKSNEVYLLKKNNIKYNLLEPKDYGFNSGAVNMFTSESTLNKLGVTNVQNIINATNKGWKYAFENVDETIDLIYNKYNTSLNKSKEALRFEAEEIKNMFLLDQYLIGEINKEELFRWYDILNNYGLITNNNRFNGFLFNQEWQEATYSQEQINMIAISIIFVLIVLILSLYFSKSKAKLLEEKNNQIIAQQKAFKTIFEDASDGLLIIKNNDIIDCNKSFVNMFGFNSKNEVLNNNIYILFPKYQANAELSNSYFDIKIEETKKNETSTFEFLLKKVDEEEFWVEVTLTNMILNKDNVIHISVRDISQRKELENSLKVREFELLESRKLASLGEMIGNIAHQWRQPLSAICMLLSSMKLEKQIGVLDDNSFYKKIDDTLVYTDQLTTTIETFRNFIKGDKTKKISTVQDVVNKTLDIVSSTLRDNNIRINHNLKEVDDIKVNIVADELAQVLMNILNNAKDALNSSNTVDKWIEINIQKNEELAILTIEDNGGGIAENIISHVFDPYFTTKHKSQGTGLGLHMSYRIINESMNGSLYVQNSENGAKFYIKIPLP